MQPFGTYREAVNQAYEQYFVSLSFDFDSYTKGLKDVQDNIKKFESDLFEGRTVFYDEISFIEKRFAHKDYYVFDTIDFEVYKYSALRHDDPQIKKRSLDNEINIYLDEVELRVFDIVRLFPLKYIYDSLTIDRLFKLQELNEGMTLTDVQDKWIKTLQFFERLAFLHIYQIRAFYDILDKYEDKRNEQEKIQSSIPTLGLGVQLTTIYYIFNQLKDKGFITGSHMDIAIILKLIFGLDAKAKSIESSIKDNIEIPKREIKYISFKR